MTSAFALRVMLLALGLFLLQGCGLPHDTESTLRNLEGGVLRAGVVEPDPEGQALLRRFAAEHEATVEEIQAPPQTLLQALKERKLHIVYGKIDKTSVLAGEAPTSRPYRTIYAVLSGEQAPEEEVLRQSGVSAGEQVESLWLKVHTEYPVREDSPYRVVLSPRKPERRSLDLPVQRYVYLMPPGEHRYLLELDRFLHNALGSNR